MKTGLVLEGGGMRGMFTVGILDVMLEAGIRYDGIVGVSAGAAFGCNYKSHQAGRALRYNKRFARDKRYMGLGSLVRTGNLVNAEFAYHTVPTQFDRFDCETFAKDETAFHLVCTDVRTGKPVYHQLENVDYEALEWIRATASMPGVSQAVPIGGKLLLDGGISNSIPLQYFQQAGYERNVVVLTQPKGYFKKPSRLTVALLKVFARKYPAIIEAMKRRHEMYNAQLEYIAAEEAASRALLIYPDAPLDISRLESNPDKLQAVYDMGRQKGESMLRQIVDFCQNS